MMISTKGRYALRVMLDMAEHGGSEWHRLSDVAQRQQLSKKYLETIMAALSRANLVESAVGKSGGYRLTRSPEDYPVGEILRAVEGNLSPIACQSEDGSGCGASCDCDARLFWQGLEDQINSYVGLTHIEPPYLLPVPFRTAGVFSLTRMNCASV